MMLVSVEIGFRYILNSKLLVLLMEMCKSRKWIGLLFSRVNFMLGWNELRVFSKA